MLFWSDWVECSDKQEQKPIQKVFYIEQIVLPADIWRGYLIYNQSSIPCQAVKYYSIELYSCKLNKKINDKAMY